MEKTFPELQDIMCTENLQQVGSGPKLQMSGTSELKYKDSKVTANASYRYTVKAYYEASGKRIFR